MDKIIDRKEPEMEIDFSAWDNDNGQEEEHDPTLVYLEEELGEPDYTLNIGGVGCLPRGDIAAVKAKSKNGKTYLCSILAAALLGDETFGISRENEHKVLYIDTEQNKRHTNRLVVRIHQILGLDAKKSRHDISRGYALRTIAKEQIQALIEEKVKKWCPTAVIIDGIADLCRNYNDPVESDKVIDFVMKLASNYDCAVVCVLHTNKQEGDQNMKGHLGTLLLQKSSDVFQVTKKGLIFDVEQTDTRNAPCPPWAFSLDCWGNPVPALTSEKERINRTRYLFESFFDGKESASRCELVKFVSQQYSVKDRSADERIKQAVNDGILMQLGRGKYALKNTANV